MLLQLHWIENIWVVINIGLFKPENAVFFVFFLTWVLTFLLSNFPQHTYLQLFDHFSNCFSLTGCWFTHTTYIRSATVTSYQHRKPYNKTPNKYKPSRGRMDGQWLATFPCPSVGLQATRENSWPWWCYFGCWAHVPSKNININTNINTDSKYCFLFFLGAVTASLS